MDFCTAGGWYYISTTVDGETKYLTIGGQNNAPVTLSDTPQDITVTVGTENYAGMIRLTNSAGQAVNLFGGNASQGFGAYNDFKENEWQTLCRVQPIKTVEAVSSNGTVINLFDYWVDTDYQYDTSENGNSLPSGYYTSGINHAHALKFKPSGLSGANAWTGSEDVYMGIVAKKLGDDGYPTLSGADIFGDDYNQYNQDSLAYLFSPTYTGSSSDYRKAYRNVKGLLQVDSEGYYYYNSKENYAEYDEENNQFNLYDDWAVTYTPSSGTANNGQFFPFNAFDTVSRSTNANSTSLNHYFGMTLTARFAQQYEGHTTAKKTTDMMFQFSGDDDVWIFIDGVLVADLGGIHDAASVKIDFSTGEVTVNGVRQTTIKAAFEAAGEASKTLWRDDNTFADDTYHTLKFYYLERGSFASNLHLKYNLNNYPPTSIYKVLTVRNSTGYELPVTGGSGTCSFILGGAFLMACSLLGGYLWYKGSAICQQCL